MRHPKRCQTFDNFGECKFIDCAYLHVKDGGNYKVDALEKEVKELRDEVQKLIQNKYNSNNLKIEMHEKEIIVLNYEVNQLNINLKKTQIFLDELTKKATTETKIKETDAGDWFYCNIWVISPRAENDSQKMELFFSTVMLIFHSIKVMMAYNQLVCIN